MEQGVIVIAVFGFVLGIVVLGIFFNKDAVLKRKLRKVPLTPIQQAREGNLVRVTGVVQPDGLTLTGPFSGRSCGWYGVWVEEYRSSGKSGHWYQIIHEERFTDFEIEDASGRARVRMADPRVAALKDTHCNSGTFDDATGVEEAFLARHGGKSTGFFGLNRRLRYREATLEVGEAVTVMGKAQADFDRRGRKIVVVERHPETGLALSDDPSTLT